MNILTDLFLTFAKIGLFTFGGGYAMISVIEHNCIECKQWITHDDMMNITVIAESTPGPIAINCATYIGYKREGILGSIVATLGMCIPSFTIIFLISLFFDKFLEISLVSSAFKGIRICVIYLILSAGIKMLKKLKKTPFNLAVMLITFFCVITVSLIKIGFSSIFYIIIFGSISLSIYAFNYFKERSERK